MNKKKFDIKSMLVGLVVGIGIFGCTTAAGILAENVYFSQFPIVLNGRNYTSGSAILNYMGSTYVPLKELGELTGSTVTFTNNTIYVNNGTNSNVNNNYGSTSFNEITLEEDATETVFVNLSKYNAQSATVSNSSSCVTISQMYFSYNGTFAIEAIEDGNATITIRYNTGAIEYVYVTVEGDDEENLEIEVDDYEYIEIDLDDYDADKATLSITKGSSYITLNKTKLTSDGKVKVTGDKEGEATIKIKYDTGDVEYVYVEVIDEDDEDDELEIEVDDYEYIDIDLDDYDADKATLSITKGSSYISLNKTKLTSDGSVKVTGDKEGSATIKIKYDTGDVEYVYVEVVDECNENEYDYNDFDYEEEIDVDVDDYETYYINLEKHNAVNAEISVISGKDYISLGKVTVTESDDIKIYGDEEGASIVKIKYSTGEIDYLWIEVND